MSFKYYDYSSGQLRYKRRYIWGFQGYALGVITMLILLVLLQGGIQ